MKEIADIHALGEIEETGSGYRVMHRSGKSDALSNVNKDRIVAKKREMPTTRRSTRIKKRKI